MGVDKLVAGVCHARLGLCLMPPGEPEPDPFPKEPAQDQAHVAFLLMPTGDRTLHVLRRSVQHLSLVHAETRGRHASFIWSKRLTPELGCSR